MKNLRPRRVAAGLSLALALGLAALPAAQEKGFKALFNGKNLKGFKPVFKDGADPAATWRVEKGVLVCTGKPNGYLVTEKSYKNYVLRYDWKYARPAGLEGDDKFNGNSGCLVHITGEHKIWPKSVEVQGAYKDHANIFAIGGAPKGDFKKDGPAQKAAFRPVGEWNTTEVTSQDGKLTSKLNGVQVCEGRSELKEGPIGFQSEGAEMHWRNITIKEIK